MSIRSNVLFWQMLQDQDGGYFNNHPFYRGESDIGGGEACIAIEAFLKLQSDMNVVVIGCGYGRESLYLAPRVKQIYGIDVSHSVLSKAVNFLKKRQINNFIPVLADEYESKIPQGIDIVFSIVVMQHLTRDLVYHYFKTLGKRLTPTGAFVVQFLEILEDGVDKLDAELRAYEPAVSWTVSQLAELSREANVRFVEVRSILALPTALWHWAYFTR